MTVFSTIHPFIYSGRWFLVHLFSISRFVSLLHEIDPFEFDICSQRVFMKYRLPLREIVVDFYNELKSLTSGYASFDYEDAE